MPRKYRMFGYPADDEEGPTRLVLFLFFLLVCAALAALVWWSGR
jgi:hypothetical protein